MESTITKQQSITTQNTSISRECIKDFFNNVEYEVKFLMDRWGFDNLVDYVSDVANGQKTQTKTKLISNFYENFLVKSLTKYGYNVQGAGENGYDIIIDDVKYEVKLTLSNEDNWTGNSFSKVKVPNVILIKLDFDENCNIKDCFFGILNMKHSKWKGDTEKGNSGFSTLVIVKEDINNLKVIFGNIKKNRVNLGIIKENYRNGEE